MFNRIKMIAIDSGTTSKSELKEITADRFAELSIRKYFTLSSSPY